MPELTAQQIEEIRPHPARLKQAAHFLITGFKWEHTKEGRDYWRGVYDRLHALAEMREHDENESNKQEAA